MKEGWELKRKDEPKPKKIQYTINYNNFEKNLVLSEKNLERNAQTLWIKREYVHESCIEMRGGRERERV